MYQTSTKGVLDYEVLDGEDDLLENIQKIKI